MFTPLRRRLAIVNAAIIAAIVVGLAAGILLLMDRVLIDQQTSELDETARTTLARLEGGDTDLPIAARPEDSAFFVVWDRAGNATANGSGVALGPLTAAAKAALGGASATAVIRLGSTDALVESMPVERNGAVVGALQVGRSLQPVRDVEGRMALLVGALGALGLLLSVVAGWLLAERSLVPIRRAFRRQQEFAADASHEMRTPLSVVDAGLQVLRRHPERSVRENGDVIDSMTVQVKRMESLVGGLLTLARADAGAAEVAPRSVDVDAAVRESVEALAPLATSRAATLAVSELAAGRATLDPDRLRELVTILVDNALTHGGAGVCVDVRARRSRAAVTVEVADDGPGIAVADRSRVLERFFRTERSRSTPGSGLGLSIAAWIVRAHGGRLELLDNPAPGRGPDRPGLRVKATLPLRPPDSGDRD